MVFAALPHGLSQELAKVCYDSGKVFIDLGADFRLENEKDHKEWYGGLSLPELHEQAVYALPELFRDQIRGEKDYRKSRLLYDGGSVGAGAGSAQRVHFYGGNPCGL